MRIYRMNTFLDGKLVDVRYETRKALLSSYKTLVQSSAHSKFGANKDRLTHEVEEIDFLNRLSVVLDMLNECAQMSMCAGINIQNELLSMKETARIEKERQLPFLQRIIDDNRKQRGY